MTNLDYTTFRQRIEAAAVRCMDANAEFLRLNNSGIAEDEADSLAGLSGASDTLMDLAVAARDSGDQQLAAAAVILVEQAGLAFPFDHVIEQCAA
jgi:hypothetical protein